MDIPPITMCILYCTHTKEVAKERESYGTPLLHYFVWFINATKYALISKINDTTLQLPLSDLPACLLVFHDLDILIPFFFEQSHFTTYNSEIS